MKTEKQKPNKEKKEQQQPSGLELSNAHALLRSRIIQEDAKRNYVKRLRRTP